MDAVDLLYWLNVGNKRTKPTRLLGSNAQLARKMMSGKEQPHWAGPWVEPHVPKVQCKPFLTLPQAAAHLVTTRQPPHTSQSKRGLTAGRIYPRLCFGLEIKPREYGWEAKGSKRRGFRLLQVKITVLGILMKQNQFTQSYLWVLPWKPAVKQHLASCESSTSG